jgi:hypothetical protein
MPQFTPSDREEVAEYVNSRDHVYKAKAVGDGVFVAKHNTSSERGKNNMFHSLMESHGWYVARFTYDPSGSTLLLLPVTEAANDT